MVESLAVQIAFGPSGKQADTTGALQEIAAGAVLRFALAAASPHGLNVHVVGSS